MERNPHAPIPALSVEDTRETLVTRYNEWKEADFKVRMAAARTTIQRLLVAGAISYDDGAGEMDRSYYEKSLTQRALETGVPRDVLRRQDADLDALQHVYHNWLVPTVLHHQTPDARHALIDATLAAVPAGIDSTTGKGCRHANARHASGWQFVWDKAGEVLPGRYVCDRCKARVVVPFPTEPDEQAKVARFLLDTLFPLAWDDTGKPYDGCSRAP
jgi:hypothetical protein